MATRKQKALMKKILENPSKGGNYAGNNGMYKIMREVGYSHNSAIHPAEVLESKGWKELVDIYMPDEELTQIHKFGLYAYKRDHSPTGPDEDLPDFSNIHKFLETAYKIKGKLQDVTNTTNVLVIPDSLVGKYAITPNTGSGGEGRE